MTQIWDSIPVKMACLRFNEVKALAKPGSSMQEKCSFSRTGAEVALRMSGTRWPKPAGYCSVSKIGTFNSSATCSRVRALRKVRAGACIAGTRRSCISITQSTESEARISIGISLSLSGRVVRSTRLGIPTTIFPNRFPFFRKF